MYSITLYLFISPLLTYCPEYLSAFYRDLT